MKSKDQFNKNIEEFLTDIRLRAEFEFEDVWLKMQRDPVLAAMIDPRLLANVKKIMHHGFISGAEQAVLIVLEKVANDLCE